MIHCLVGYKVAVVTGINQMALTFFGLLGIGDPNNAELLAIHKELMLFNCQWELGSGERSKSALLALEERVRSIGGWVS